MKSEQKPITNVIFKYEQRQSINEFATVLEIIAHKLKEGQAFEIIQNDRSYEIHPSSMITAEMKYTTKGQKHSFEIELEWNEGETSNEIKIK